MFLLRCLFWLGLAFFQIAQREGTNPVALFDPVAGQTASLGQMAKTATERNCRAEPDRCVALAAEAARFAAIGAAAPSRDSLTRQDRAPSWRN
jgi:hypothetical protein